MAHSFHSWINVWVALARAILGALEMSFIIKRYTNLRFLGGLLRVDPTKPVSHVRTSVRTSSVRPSTKKFLRFK